MQKYSLKADVRTILGRKVKSLRNQGLIPGNLFGKKIKSQAISVSLKDFEKVYEHAGVTVLVDLDLNNKKVPVLISNVSRHPVLNQPLHIDFHQVDLKEKVTAKVPIEIVGEAPAVKDKIGVLLTSLDEIEVEALPQDLPEKIEVNVENLKAIDEDIKVKVLHLSSAVKILTDPELEIVKIAPLVSKEAVKQAEAEAAQAAEAQALTQAEAGAAPAAEPASTEAKPEPIAKPVEKKETPKS